MVIAYRMQEWSEDKQNSSVTARSMLMVMRMSNTPSQKERGESSPKCPFWDSGHPHSCSLNVVLEEECERLAGGWASKEQLFVRYHWCSDWAFRQYKLTSPMFLLAIPHPYSCVTLINSLTHQDALGWIFFVINACLGWSFLVYLEKVVWYQITVMFYHA